MVFIGYVVLVHCLDFAFRRQRSFHWLCADFCTQQNIYSSSHIVWFWCGFDMGRLRCMFAMQSTRRECTSYFTSILPDSGICLLCSVHSAEVISWSQILWLWYCGTVFLVLFEIVCTWPNFPPEGTSCNFALTRQLFSFALQFVPYIVHLCELDIAGQWYSFASWSTPRNIYIRTTESGNLCVFSIVCTEQNLCPG